MTKDRPAEWHCRAKACLEVSAAVRKEQDGCSGAHLKVESAYRHDIRTPLMLQLASRVIARALQPTWADCHRCRLMHQVTLACLLIPTLPSPECHRRSHKPLRHQQNNTFRPGLQYSSCTTARHRLCARQKNPQQLTKDLRATY